MNNWRKLACSNVMVNYPQLAWHGSTTALLLLLLLYGRLCLSLIYSHAFTHHYLYLVERVDFVMRLFFLLLYATFFVMDGWMDE